jgi:hypothetical protein
MVFLSYRHENNEHKLRVRKFALELKAAGVDVVLDQFFDEATPGGYNDGWARWSNENAKAASVVLIIASPGWFRCFDGNEQPGTGLGAAGEANIIYHELQEAQWKSEKHRIVLLGRVKVNESVEDEGDVNEGVEHHVEFFKA